MSRLLYFDCFSGAAGDMIVGALLDAGLPLRDLQHLLSSLAIEGLTVEAEPVDRAGVRATKFRVREPAPTHHHDHEHHHHHHRRLEDIERLIERSALSGSGKRRASAMFQRLASVEASIHGIPVERVHFHEVGAIDSIVDVISCVFGVERFQVDEIVASPLNVGGGTVRCEHGVFPVPAPATAALLRNASVYSSGVSAELVTPTGALVVTDFARRFGPLPAMRIEAIGYGAGDRDFKGTPNVVRVLVGATDTVPTTETVLLIEFEVDDMNPQLFGAVMDHLYAAGALDVFFVPVQMKKSRPGTLVTVIGPVDRREALASILFRETTTIGLRYQEVQRERLEREIVTVQTALGPAGVKIARRDSHVVNVAPEFEDCARIAEAHHLPIKEVQAMVHKAYLDTKD